METDDARENVSTEIELVYGPSKPRDGIVVHLAWECGGMFMRQRRFKLPPRQTYRGTDLYLFLETDWWICTTSSKVFD